MSHTTAYPTPGIPMRAHQYEHRRPAIVLFEQPSSSDPSGMHLDTQVMDTQDQRSSKLSRQMRGYNEPFKRALQTFSDPNFTTVQVQRNAPQTRMEKILSDQQWVNVHEPVTQSAKEVAMYQESDLYVNGLSALFSKSASLDLHRTGAWEWVNK